MINEAKPLKLFPPKALNTFESISKCVESLGISSSNKNSIECLRLSKKNEKLKVFNVDHTSRNEIVRIIELFEQVKRF